MNDSLSYAVKGTVGLGPALNVDLVASKKGCGNCEVQLTSKITVNGKKYNESTPAEDAFYTKIE